MPGPDMTDSAARACRGGKGADRGHEKTSSAPDSSASPKKEATFPSPSRRGAPNGIIQCSVNQPQRLNSTLPPLKRCSSRFIIWISPVSLLCQTKDRWRSGAVEDCRQQGVEVKNRSLGCFCPLDPHEDMEETDAGRPAVLRNGGFLVTGNEQYVNQRDTMLEIGSRDIQSEKIQNKVVTVEERREEVLEEEIEIE
ncbi:hypothetical protein EYF80_036779 [Liparis tanakae]|uniref:Uncharacterized protein n=1 Tax=Liparis tanakae TaxID=230148 RepID=A0A4Z2GHK4_9TELE|nr:hypothetical protein EYF80_036779 [Liparis tanakae]